MGTIEPLGEQNSHEDRMSQNWARAMAQLAGDGTLRDSQTDAGRMGGTQTKAQRNRDLGLKPAKGDFGPASMQDGD